MSDKTFQAGLLGLSNASRQVLTLIATIFLARYLSQSNYGTFQQYQLIAGLFVTVFPTGLPRLLLIKLPVNRDRLRDVWASNQLSLVTLAALCLILMLAFGGQLSRFFSNDTLGSLMPVIAVSIAAAIPVTSVVPALIANKRYNTIVLFTFTTRAAWLIGLIVVSLVYRDDMRMLFLMIMAVNIAILFASLPLMYSVNNTSQKLFDWNFIKDDWGLALPLGMSSIVSIIAFRIDKILVSTFFDPSYYAIFSIGSMEVPLIGYISGSACAVAMPLLAKMHNDGDKNGMIELWHKVISKSASLLIPIMGGVMVFAHDLIILAFGEKYEEATVIFLLYLLLIPAHVVAYSTLMIACRVTKRILLIELICAIVNVAGGIVMIKVMGPPGVVVVTIAVFYGGIAFGYLPWFAKYFERSVQSLYPVRNLLYIIGSTMAGVAILMVFKYSLGLSTSIPFIVVSWIAYAAITLWLIKKTIGIDWFSIVASVPSKLIQR